MAHNFNHLKRPYPKKIIDFYYNIFAIVQSTVSDLLKDSNPLGLELKSPGSSSTLKYVLPVSELEPLSPGIGTWNAASRPV